MTRGAARGLALAIGVLACVAILVAREGLRGDRDAFELADNRASVDRVLADRARTAAEPSPEPRLVREAIPEEIAEELFTQLSHASAAHLYDPEVYFRLRPGLHRRVPFEPHPGGAIVLHTNSLGLRQDDEVRAEKPDLRILVTGDSHTEGACDNAESFAHVLQVDLSAEAPGRTVEVINAGKTGWSFYNYLGALEKYAYLEPDVFVCAVYSGNDFLEGLLLHHYFQRTLPPSGREDLQGGRGAPDWLQTGAFAQSMQQLLYFQRHPAEADVALDAAVLTVDAMAKLCAERGIRFVCLLIPPMADVQPGHFDPPLDEVCAKLGLDERARGATERLSDRWIAALAERGIAVLDLRGPFRRTEERLYWPRDHHIDLAGCRAVAAALAEATRDLLR